MTILDFYRAAGALSKGDRSCGRKIWLCPARATTTERGLIGELKRKTEAGAPP